jgi:hypothetical protein
MTLVTGRRQGEADQRVRQNARSVCRQIPTSQALPDLTPWSSFDRRARVTKSLSRREHDFFSLCVFELAVVELGVEATACQ